MKEKFKTPIQSAKMENYIFTNSADLWRLIFITVCTYIALIILLRSAGKRTLAKMNAFDFVITIGIGSVFAIVMMDKTVSLMEGIVALALLIGLQFAITWSTVNIKALNGVVRSSPTLLLYDGEMIERNMKKERVTESEVLASLRKEGVHSISNVRAVVLESNGETSILMSDGSKTSETLHNVN